MDIFLAIEEKLGEQQNNEDYANWRDNLSYNNSSSIPNSNDQHIDQKNDNQIKNPLIKRPKGRLAGTARFKEPLEASTKSNIVGSKTQNKCSLCNNVGHNRAIYPSNSDQKKRKI
ncbi:hypothetical protein C1646_772009 [Rhizophagus diaphanus]|nr:hypothetical protein C1646_772009 [Rhizophagus diaphanus] [Rhizophagus sp. MUCL 43196]